MTWVVAALCVLGLLVVFATMKKGTASIVLGSFMLVGIIANLDRASVWSIAYGSTFAAVVLLWGISHKLEARYLTGDKAE